MTPTSTVTQPLLPPGPLAPIRQYPADGNDTVKLAWPPDKPAEAGNDDGAVTPGGGFASSLNPSGKLLRGKGQDIFKLASSYLVQALAHFPNVYSG